MPVIAQDFMQGVGQPAPALAAPTESHPVIDFLGRLSDQYTGANVARIQAEHAQNMHLLDAVLQNKSLALNPKIFAVVKKVDPQLAEGLQQSAQVEQAAGAHRAMTLSQAMQPQQDTSAAPQAGADPLQQHVAEQRTELQRLQKVQQDALADPNTPPAFLAVLKDHIDRLDSHVNEYGIETYKQGEIGKRQDKAEANTRANMAVTQGQENARHAETMAQAERHFKVEHPEMSDLIGALPKEERGGFANWMNNHPEMTVDPKAAVKAYAKESADTRKSIQDIDASFKMIDEVQKFMDKNNLKGDSIKDSIMGHYRGNAITHGLPLDKTERQLGDLVSQLESVSTRSYIANTRLGQKYLERVTAHLPKVEGTYDSIRQQLRDVKQFLTTLKKARTPDDLESSVVGAPAGSIPPPPPGFEIEGAPAK